MSGEIIVSDVLAEIKEEIRVLRVRLAELLQERDDLIYHICPELRAKYAKEIGDYLNRANHQQLMVSELKRRIEIAMAALNREQSISEEEVDQQIEEEYQEFHQKVDEEYQKSKQSQEKQAQKEEKRKFYEEQWNNQYGEHREDQSADSNNEENDAEDHATNPKEKPLPNAKELYRKIVKKLHPDMNPNATEHDLELFNRAVKAYEEGDLMTLQAIYEEIYGLPTEMPQEESMEDLICIKLQLLGRITRVMSEIWAIKSEFPYTEKAFLDDPEAVKAKRDAIIRLIGEYEEVIIRLNEVLEEIHQKMEELRQQKGDKNHE